MINEFKKVVEAKPGAAVVGDLMPDHYGFPHLVLLALALDSDGKITGVEHQRVVTFEKVETRQSPETGEITKLLFVGEVTMGLDGLFCAFQMFMPEISDLAFCISSPPQTMEVHPGDVLRFFVAAGEKERERWFPGRVG